MADQNHNAGTGGSIEALIEKWRERGESTPNDLVGGTMLNCADELAALLTRRDQPLDSDYPWDEVRANYWFQVRQFFTKDAAGEMMAVCSAAAVANARHHDDQQIADLQRRLALTRRDAPPDTEWRLVRIGEVGPVHGGHGSWVETDHPAVVACMGSAPPCIEGGCQLARRDAPQEPHEFFDDWASHIVSERMSKSDSQLEYEIVEALQKAAKLGRDADPAKEPTK